MMMMIMMMMMMMMMMIIYFKLHILELIILYLYTSKKFF